MFIINTTIFFPVLIISGDDKDDIIQRKMLRPEFRIQTKKQQQNNQVSNGNDIMREQPEELKLKLTLTLTQQNSHSTAGEDPASDPEELSPPTAPAAPPEEAVTVTTTMSAVSTTQDLEQRFRSESEPISLSQGSLESSSTTSSSSFRNSNASISSSSVTTSDRDSIISTSSVNSMDTSFTMPSDGFIPGGNVL